MTILVLDGNPDPANSSFQHYLEKLNDQLESRGHTLQHVTLAGKHLKQCVGCWSCWVKTPGRCFVADDADDIRRTIMHSQFVLFASPLRMGFTSALLKTLQDKLLPLVHPYVELVQNEAHHIRRYPSYPLLGLLVEKELEMDEDDLEIVRKIYERLALNFKTKLAVFQTTDAKQSEVADAIGRL